MSGTNPTEVDPSALFESLLSGDVVSEREDGTVVTTAEFEDERDLFYQTYGDLDEERYYEVVASAFDLSPETARERVEELGVTREEVVAYFALRSYLAEAFSMEELVVMAGMVADVGVESPVPDDLPELTDESYESFLAEQGDAVVFVWRHHCDPCEALKDDLPAVLDALPDAVGVAGIDGEEAPAFRRDFEVTSAPTVLLFCAGDLVDALAGRQSVERYREAFADAY